MLAVLVRLRGGNLVKVDPRVAARHLVLSRPLAGTEGEEVPDHRRLAGADDEGLAVHHVPGVRILVLLIDVGVDRQHGRRRGGVGIKRHLRGIPALLPVFMEQLHHLQRIGGEGFPVGGVKHQIVHIRQRQHLDMTAHHIGVRRMIPAEQRLPPPIVHAARQRAAGIQHGGKSLGRIGLGGAEGIKHRHLPTGRCGRIRRQCPSHIVGGGKTAHGEIRLLQRDIILIRFGQGRPVVCAAVIRDGNRAVRRSRLLDRAPVVHAARRQRRSDRQSYSK